MCFTPQISFTIFAIEWILGFIVLYKSFKAKRKTAYELSALLLFLLGFYQFTQYMLCTSLNYELWGKMGFLAYDFLPAIGFHFAYSLIGKTPRNMYLVYVLPTLFALIALLNPAFVSKAECSTVFIIVTHSWDRLLSALYGLYYTLFIVMTLLIYKGIGKMKSPRERKAATIGFYGTIAFTLPTLILIILLPQLNIAFPSIYCEFALIFAISVFYMIRALESR